MFKHLFIDLDDTVLDFKKGQHDAFMAAFCQYGFSVSEEDYAEYNRWNSECWKIYERGEMDKETMLLYRYSEYLRRHGLPEKDAARVNRLYADALAQQGTFIPGAEEGLRILKKNYRISLVTNGIAYVQRSRLAVAGIAEFFDHIFISDEIGFRKPQKEFFDYCLSASAANPSEILVIGDSPTSDIQGAKNASLPALFFNRKHKECPYPFIKEVDCWDSLLSFLSIQS